MLEPHTHENTWVATLALPRAGAAVALRAPSPNGRSWIAVMLTLAVAAQRPPRETDSLLAETCRTDS